jgi:hypothetical protein
MRHDGTRPVSRDEGARFIELLGAYPRVARFAERRVLTINPAETDA